MKVLVTGVNGQLGYDVAIELNKRGITCVGTGSKPATDAPCDAYYPMDITDADAVATVMRAVKPDVVIHCAAWTAVDAAEEPENYAAVHAVNAQGTRHLAALCRELNCIMLYVSTDYVFDGQGSEPWQPDCRSFAPLNVYGQSKLDGENAVRELVEKHFIVRISWVFGAHGGNFVKTMLKLSETHDTLRVVCDQIGRPTYTPDLARLLVDMIGTEKYGTYHATNEGENISWYDFACEIFRQARRDTKVIPVTTEEYGQSKARRPYNSRLDTSKLSRDGFDLLPDWPDALVRFFR